MIEPMTRLAFAPHIPLPLLALLVAVALADHGLSASARGARGAWARGLAFAVLLFALAGPVAGARKRMRRCPMWW